METDIDGPVHFNRFKDDSYCKSFGGELLNLRKSSLYTDVTLRNDDVSIPCHRVVLCAAPSHYFRAMFASGFEEGSSTEIDLQNIGGEILEALVDYIYTAEIDITSENVEDLLAACEMLQFDSLKQACERFMLQHLDASNCIGLYRFSRVYKSENLRRHARGLMMEDFRDVVSGPEFNELNEEELTEYIIDDELRVDNEDPVFEAVVRWVDHGGDGNDGDRREHFPYLLHHIRLPFCTPQFLFGVVKREKLMASADCLKYLDEALSYHLLPEKKNESDNPRLKPRRNFPAQQGLVLFGGMTKDAQDSQFRPNMHCWCFREKSQTWEWFSEVPKAGQLKFYSASVVPRGILITGGLESNVVQRGTWLFDIVENRWNPNPPMFGARCRHASVVYGDCVYVIGGATCKRVVYNDGEVLKSVERFDCRSQKWTPGKPLKTAVLNPMAVSVGRHIFVLGGTETDKYFSPRTQALDTVWQEWSERAEMPEPCKLGAAVTVRERVYVLGGYTRTCLSYDTGLDQWTRLAEPRDMHGAGTAVVWQGRVLLAGGKKKVDGEKVPSATIEEYDWEKDCWTVWAVQLKDKLCEHFMFNVPLFPNSES